MAVKCGHCGRREPIADVAACAQQEWEARAELAAELALEQALEYSPVTAWEEEQDMLRTLDTDPIWGVQLS